MEGPKSISIPKDPRSSKSKVVVAVVPPEEGVFKPTDGYHKILNFDQSLDSLYEVEENHPLAANGGMST